MTTHHDEAVVCECGHKGFVHWSENDAPFSKQWESYYLIDFDGDTFQTDGFATVQEALTKMKPKCPKCGQVGKVKPT